MSRIWAWLFLLVLVVFFTVTIWISSEGDVNFLTLRNSQNILMAITPVMLMGLGQTFVIIAAGVDLSVNWVMGLASVFTALAIRDLMMPLGTLSRMNEPAVILTGIVAGLVVGAVVLVVERRLYSPQPGRKWLRELVTATAGLAATVLASVLCVAFIRDILERSGIRGPVALVFGVVLGIVALLVVRRLLPRYFQNRPVPEKHVMDALRLGISFLAGLVVAVLGALIGAVFLRDNALSEVVVIIIGFVSGALITLVPGFINGWVIAKLRVPPFIVTLGMAFIARGVAYLLSGGNTVGNQPPGVRNFGNESLMYVISGDNGGVFFFNKPDVVGETLTKLDRVLAWPVVMTFIAVAIAMFVLHRTRYGRHTYAIGGNREAALRAGVPVDRHVITLYMFSAFTAGLAGVMHTARFSGGSPIAGDPLLLSSIAAVIIGGVSMFGGSGTVIGTLIGALIIAVLTTGLVMLNVEPFYQFIVVAVVVILAVLIDQSRDILIGRMEQERG